jgi:hypothetical protein
VSGRLLETGATIEGAGWELVDTISSLLLFWFMEASILMVVDNIDDSFCMKQSKCFHYIEYSTLDLVYFNCMFFLRATFNLKY